MRKLNLAPKGEQPAILQDFNSPESGILQRLAALCLPKSDEGAAERAANLTIAPWSRSEPFQLPGNLDFALETDPETHSFRAEYRDPAAIHSDPGTEPMNLRRLSLLTFASAILRGADYLPVHGAMLCNSRGAVLLCGESGVGKSTTSERWKALGADFCCPADDMVLLSHHDGRFMAYPLPTWSRYALAPGAESFPVENGYPVNGVLCLERGDPAEKIETVSEAEFFAQVYCSFYFHIKFAVHVLRGGERALLRKHVERMTNLVVRHFPPKGLFARLDGDLRETLKEYQ
jgi:hypothetical protein